VKRVAEQIADWLAAQGIEHVFAVTGGGALFLNHALGDHDVLRCTFMHHEQACSMAAEGYARIAGKPAVLMVTTGPGAINAFNGVFGAYTDSIPMIVLSGQTKRETTLDFFDLPNMRQLGDQEGPTVHMAQHICKYAKTIHEAADLNTVLPEALHAAISGRPGPVWIEVPIDIQSAFDELDINPMPALKSETRKELAAQCREIIDRLKKANRPIIMGGTGVRLANVVKRVVALVERTGIPMTTAWTHDLIASDHPLFAGRPGTIGTRAGNFCVQAADVVLVLGSRLNIRQTSYNFDCFAKNAWVAQVDVDAAEFEKPTYQPSLGVEADLNTFLDVFEQELKAHALKDYSAWADWCRRIGVKYQAVNEHQQLPNKPLSPYLVVDRIFKHMRSDDIAACGNASACILPFQVGKLKTDQRLFSNSGSASMGYDLPAAIGAAMADRKRRVICFAGDGSIMMNIQEFQTLLTAQVNVVVIILNNEGYLSIWQASENVFGKALGATPATGVDFPDYQKVATAFGIESHKIQSTDDLTRLDQLMTRDGPLLIEIMIDPRQEFNPRLKSRLNEQGQYETPELDDMFPFLDRDVLNGVRDSANAIASA
jgi:acetolactate synthase-1/2/3 large subunit